jgi:thymidylate synthase ThyX/5-methylcytosine-specific restriction endonuclease McrA
VLEHANISMLLYGIDRAVTHELVRHRAGWGFCLAGDTEVYSERWAGKNRNGCRKRTIEQLFKMTLTSHGRSRLRLLKLRCLDENEGTFTTGRVKSVVCSGKQPVFRVELFGGKTITCTKEHRFLTLSGWKSLNDIVGGLGISARGIATYTHLQEPLLTNGTPCYRSKVWLRTQYHDKGLEQAQIAALVGCSEDTIRAWVRKHSLQKPLGSWSRGKAPWNYGKRYKTGKKMSRAHRRTLSARMSGPGNPSWKGGITRRSTSIRRGVEKLRQTIMLRDAYCCRLCKQRARKLTLHHVIPVWARPDLVLVESNIVTLCRSCHLKVNGHEEEYLMAFGHPPDAFEPSGRPVGGGHILAPKPRHIRGIKYLGYQMTYDIEMEDPHHNFVANGVIVHNSQVSQRYVDGPLLRFVERPEYWEDEELHARFTSWVDYAAREYDLRSGLLLAQQKMGSQLLSGEKKRDLRKKVNQAARACLPNETEAPIVVTGNVRAIRHGVEMRAHKAADITIRDLACKIHECVKVVAPMLFSDHELEQLPDGTRAVQSKYRKV